MKEQLRELLNFIPNMDNKVKSDNNSISFVYSTDRDCLASRLIDGIIGDGLTDITMLTKDEEVLHYAKNELKISNSLKSIDEDIKDVVLVNELYSTAEDSVDMMYGDILVAIMKNGMTKFVFDVDIEERRVKL